LSSVAASIILPIAVYAIVIRRCVRQLVRIPPQRSLSAFGDKLGAERLWQNVFLGILAIVFTVLFSPVDIALVAMTLALAVNSCVAFYALRHDAPPNNVWPLSYGIHAANAFSVHPRGVWLYNRLVRPASSASLRGGDGHATRGATGLKVIRDCSRSSAYNQG